MHTLLIYNAAVITPCRIIQDAIVLVENGLITSVSAGRPSVRSGWEAIDAQGCYLSPGFIDIHNHGGGGHDFMDGTVEAFIGAAETHLVHGTTALVPTTVSCDETELFTILRLCKTAREQNSRGAELLGLHLEGPYLSKEQKGAQDERYLKYPDKEEYERILAESDEIIRWSAAAELPGAMVFARCLRSHGILPSIGHSNAVYGEVVKAFENGFTHVTHLYSGTSGVRRIGLFRHGGVIESAFLIEGMTVEIIADGCHLPPELLKLVYSIKGVKHIALVTDSMRAAGLPEGPSVLGSLHGGQPVIVEDGIAKLPDRSSFAGSTATADRLVQTMVQQADVPLIDAVRMMSLTPAEVIGVSDRKGSIVPGKDADIVLFDKNICVKKVFLHGRLLYDCQDRVD
jgi:N-acetylglucosamine-6-phosphate deacetylase